MNYGAEVVGFDAREMWLDVDSQWSQQRWNLQQVKDEILLKLDVLKPLSVDRIVWHSVFSEVSDPRLWQTVSRKPQYAGKEWNDLFSESRKLSAPDAYRRGGTWRNLSILQNYLQKSWGNVWKPCSLVAIVEIFSDERDKTDTQEHDIGLEPIWPNSVENQWELLGYDVADYDLITGLFDPIRDSVEATNLRHDWRDHLNEHHLFKEPKKAFDYITVANKRKPSHTPYYIYTMYRVQEIELSNESLSG